MKRASHGGCLSRGAKSFIEACDTFAAHCGIDNGKLKLTVHDYKAAGADLVFSARFSVPKSGGAGVPVAGPVMRKFTRPSAADLRRLCDAFNPLLQNLSYGYGSLVLKFKDGKLCEVRPRPRFRREETSDLDNLLGVG